MDYFVVVEFRPNLRACQFYIKKKLNEETTEIDLQHNMVYILDDGTRIEIIFPDKVDHIVDSVSNLIFEDDSICFRTRTNPCKTYGSFNRELILPKKDVPSPFPLPKYAPTVRIGEPVNIFCRQCLHSLTNNEVTFERILPLPLSTSGEDFFCHANQPPLEGYLNPRLNDCLYSLFFYKVNPSLFEVDLFDKNIFVCPKCSSWLGIVKSTYIQLWNSTTILSDCTPMGSDDIALQDFLMVIKLATSEKFTSDRTNKLVIQYIDNSKDNSVDEYLLVWILEKNLCLFTSREQPDKIELQQQQVLKLLYSHEEGRTDVVKEWLSNDSNMVPVSKNMFLQGLEYLDYMSQNIPQKFRTVNDMKVTYVSNLK